MDIPVELGDLRNNIELLVSHDSVELDNLVHTPNVQKAVESIKLAVALLYDTPNYHVITNMISQYPMPSNMKPNTVASFLFGCSLSSGSMNNKMCTPFCANGIPDKRHNNHQCCPYQVWYLNGNKLVPLKPTENKDAYVFSSSAHAFSKDHIKSLEAAGVNRVQLVTIDPANNYQNVDNLRSIYALPRRNEQNQGSTNGPRQIGGGGSWLWLILILAVIVIIAAIWFYSRQNYEYYP